MTAAILPAGTTATTLSAVVDYFFTPILNTFFQLPVIEILLFAAGVGICLNAVVWFLRKLRGSSEDNAPLSSFSPQGVADAAAGTAAFRAGASVDASAKIRATPLDSAAPLAGSFYSRMAKKGSDDRDKDFQEYHSLSGRKSDVWLARRAASRKVSTIDTQDLRVSKNKRRKIGRAINARSRAEYKYGVGAFRNRDMSLPF
jgi:hypothetical protein